MAELKLNAVVTQKVLLTKELMIMRLKPEGWTLPDFKSGQYCAIGLPGSAKRVSHSKPEAKPSDPDKLIRRAYSIASAPQEKGHLELYITHVPEGALTPRIFNLEIGDRIFVQPKITGLFTLEGTPDNVNLVLMATGTGLAPYISMIRSGILSNTKRRVIVLHGVRHSWDLSYASELQLLTEAYAHFTYVGMISRPKLEPAPWEGPTGYVQDNWKNGTLEKILGARPKPSDTHTFLCGNPAMIDQVVEALGKEGFTEHSRKTPGQIHVERYW